MDTALGIAFIGFIVFFSHLLVGMFSRTKIPDILWLFFIGLVIGPLLNLVDSKDFGIVGPLFTTLTLVFILFQSGLNLRISDIAGLWKGIAAITVLNFFFTAVSGTLFMHFVVGTGILQSVILGSLLGGTSSAVVTSLVRQYDIRNGTSTVLVMESALSDVLTVTIPLALFRLSDAGEFHVGLITGQMAAAAFFALLGGGLGALVWSIVLKRVRGLENSIFTTPAFAFIIYGIVESLGFSGPVGALAFGIGLGNIKALPIGFVKKVLPEKPLELNSTEKAFFAETVFLLRTFFFIYIGLSLELHDTRLMLYGLAFTLLLFAVRLPVVWLSVPKSTSAKDASLMAVMIPKGLAAAVLATIPVQQGIPEGQTIQTLAFAVILFSTLLTTILVFLLEKTALAVLYRRFFFAFGTPPTASPPLPDRKGTTAP